MTRTRAGIGLERVNFWLTKLNQFGGNYLDAEMIKAFITSFEYRTRYPKYSVD